MEIKKKKCFLIQESRLGMAEIAIIQNGCVCDEFTFVTLDIGLNLSASIISCFCIKERIDD